MQKYHIWTIGCQMNHADSRHLASRLEELGYEPSEKPDDADVIVLNTCVVRQQAENKIYGKLGNLQRIKRKNPNLVIALMGCVVGVDGNVELEKKYGQVDVFLAPSQIEPLIAYLIERFGIEMPEPVDGSDDEFADYYGSLPEYDSGITAFVPAVMGCSHACAYCIIPARRGAERSRDPDAIEKEVRGVVERGVKEVMLLGQIIDRYGKDLPNKKPDLADLLKRIAAIEGLQRLRFLTSHPLWFDENIFSAVAGSDVICPQFEIALQSGSDPVLKAMKRGYTAEKFVEQCRQIREQVPGAAIHTDIIVGFPGETEEQFEETRALLEELKLDKVHIARFSPRPGTFAADQMEDDVPEGEKERRRLVLDLQQEAIQTEANKRFLDAEVEVLVDSRDGDRWRGRTPQNKLVYFTGPDDLLGQIANVKITWTGPFSLIGEAAT